MIQLSETYTYEGEKNWDTGKRVTAQRKIKTGDTVTIPNYLLSRKSTLPFRHPN